MKSILYMLSAFLIISLGSFICAIFVLAPWLYGYADDSPMVVLTEIGAGIWLIGQIFGFSFCVAAAGTY